MFLEEIALLVFVQSPFLARLQYEHIWKGLSWGRGTAPQSKPAFPQLPKGYCFILYEFFP